MNAGLLLLIAVIMSIGTLVAVALCRFSAHMDYRDDAADPGFDDGLGPTVSPSMDWRPRDKITDIRPNGRWPTTTSKTAIFDPAARTTRPFFDAVTGAYIPAPGYDPDEANPTQAHFERMQAMSFGAVPMQRKLVLFRNPAPVSTPLRAPWSPPH